MKLNIENFRICVMLEQVNGCFTRLNTLTGLYPANQPFCVAAAYVGILPHIVRSQILTCLSAGCGKSILAFVDHHLSCLEDVLILRLRSNLVDTLMEAGCTATNPTSVVIYYYCDYADQRSLHLDCILGSLLKQLYLNRQIPEIIESQLLQLCAARSRSAPETALVNIFCSSVAILSDMYLIFDGLDECDNAVWRTMLKVFNQLAVVRLTNVKVFVTCVEEGSVVHGLKGFKQIQLCPSVTSTDIKAFVESSVRLKIEDGELRIRNPSLEQDIIGELVWKANGL